MAIDTKEKEEKFKKFWEQNMARGRVSYSLTNGLVIGTIFFSLLNAVSFFVEGTSLFSNIWLAVFTFLFCFGVSYFIGYYPMWNANHFKYLTMTDKKFLKKMKMTKKK